GTSDEGQPQQPQSRAAGQHRRSPGQAAVALRRRACRHRPDRVSRSPWPRRRFARRSLCWRGVVDAVAAILRHAAAGPHPLAAKIREGELEATALSELADAMVRLERAVARLEAAAAREPRNNADEQ